MDSLKGKRILITGAGIKPLGFVFKDITTGEPSHTPIIVDNIEYKANIGTATALECVKAGATVHLISRTESKLVIIKKWLEERVAGAQVEYSVIDLTDVKDLQKTINQIPGDMPIYWVQSIGLGAGTVKIKNDNPYLLIDDLSEDLVEAEISVLKNTVSLLRILLPRFRKQEETRICIVTSMSAIRSVISGSIHMAAKGAISRFTNATMLELDKEKIFVTDIRPGGVDTGMYDTKVVQDTIIEMGKNYGYDYTKTNMFYMPPTAVGELIVTVLTSKGHVTSVNMVSRGQWPHEGS